MCGTELSNFFGLCGNGLRKTVLGELEKRAEEEGQKRTTADRQLQEGLLAMATPQRHRQRRRALGSGWRVYRR